MEKLALSTIILVVSASPAFAYIDPGSGSAILSVLLGIIVAIGVTLKTFWYKITSIFRVKPKVEKSEDKNH